MRSALMSVTAARCRGGERGEMKTPKELEEAVQSYQNGDRGSFDRIYELSYRYLYTCISRVVKNEDAAMDMLQETYLEISRSIGQLNRTEDFLSWAAMIGNRKCFAYLKKTNRMVLVGTDGEEEEADYFESIADDESFIPESILQDREKQRLMREIIDGLSDMQRLCVIGYYYNEEKQEQIAEELGIPVNTVKSHLNRAKANIKKGVLELEEKKGTRIYSLAPFMLLFLRREMEDCVFKPMPKGLRARLEADASETLPGGDGAKNGGMQAGQSMQGGQISGGSLLGRLAGASLKVKIAAGVIAACGTIAVAGAVAGSQSHPENEEAAYEESLAETGQQMGAQMDENASGSGSDTADTANTASGSSVQTEEGQTETAAVEEEERTEYGQLAISGQYDTIRNARDGLAIVCKDEKWGLVSYDNEVLVPLEYTYACNMLNDDGQTFFGNDGDYRVFDREGNEIFRTEHKIEAVSEGVVLWEEADMDAYLNAYGYVRLDGTVLYEPAVEQIYDQSGAVGFNEGYAICTDYESEQRLSADGERFPIFDARYERLYAEEMEPAADTTTQSSADGAAFDLAHPIGCVYRGYYVSLGMPFEDVYGNVYVHDAQGTQEYVLKIRDLAEYAGYSWDDPELRWVVWGFQTNGVLCQSYETTLCISLEDGSRKQYFLIDTTKQDMIEDEYGYREPVISDASILATGEFIGISESKYWLIQKDGQWGFIDHSGTVQGMFDDACRFSNGAAMVIEDGYASFIDENMEMYGERIPAQSVTTYGDVFVVTTPDGEQLCFESSTPPTYPSLQEGGK